MYTKWSTNTVHAHSANIDELSYNVCAHFISFFRCSNHKCCYALCPAIQDLMVLPHTNFKQFLYHRRFFYFLWGKAYLNTRYSKHQHHCIVQLALHTSYTIIFYNQRGHQSKNCFSCRTTPTFIFLLQSCQCIILLKFTSVFINYASQKMSKQQTCAKQN